MEIKILLHKHKQVDHTFFIQLEEGFYRVGWKLKKTVFTFDLH
jgi:hypothetical protein